MCFLIHENKGILFTILFTGRLSFHFLFYETKKPPKFSKEMINEIVEDSGFNQVSSDDNPSVCSIGNIMEFPLNGTGIH